MKIEDIYSLIPEFLCIEGCTECCRRFGVPSMKNVEKKRIMAYIRKHGIRIKKREDLTCPYVNEKGCTIYPVRPFICRLYGTSPSYPCIKGVFPTRMLHPDEEEEIFHRYMTEFS